MTEPNTKTEPVTTAQLKRTFLETVYAATKDPILVTACNFEFDRNVKRQG